MYPVRRRRKEEKLQNLIKKQSESEKIREEFQRKRENCAKSNQEVLIENKRKKSPRIFFGTIRDKIESRRSTKQSQEGGNVRAELLRWKILLLI